MQGIVFQVSLDEDNTKYWINYKGEILLYMGDKTPDQQITNDDNNTQVVTNYWDTQGMYPIFQGEISRVKESKNELEIHIDSIGKRFKQKIPEEFRQSFINNQNVRDAFQAICEFLGVKYICPPHVDEPDQPSTDGTENDPNKQLEAAKNMAEQTASAVQQAQESQEQNDSSQTNTQQTDSNTNTVTDNTEITTMQNGYNDISFDANGAIVHGSTAMEVGIDITDTLLNLEEHPLDKYLPDEEYEEGQSYLNDEKYFVMQDVRRLLNGEFFDTVHEDVMNYGAITVEPKSSSTSDIEGGVTGDVNGDGVVDDQDAIEGTGDLTPSQLWTALAGVMHDYYPKATADYWIPQLRDAPTTWTGVATVVNKIGGDKGTQDNVIRKVLGYKKRLKTTSGVDRHHSDGVVTTGYQTYRKQQQVNYNIIKGGKKLYNNMTPEQKKALGITYNTLMGH